MNRHTNGYEEALRLFEELEGLEDALVEEAMLPEEGAARPMRRPVSWRGRAAILCCALSLALALLLLRSGMDVGMKGEDADCVPNLPGCEEPGYDRPGDANDKADPVPPVQDSPVPDASVDDPPPEEAPAETEDSSGGRSRN